MKNVNNERKLINSVTWRIPARDLSVFVYFFIDHSIVNKLSVAGKPECYEKNYSSLNCLFAFTVVFHRIYADCAINNINNDKRFR